MHAVAQYDIIVIGSGPAGQKAAIQGAKARQRVLVIEQAQRVGGECVHHGTIPSKTLRESAVSLERIKHCGSETFRVEMDPDLRLSTMMSRLQHVVRAHENYMTHQLQRNNVDILHGRARFVAPYELEVLAPQHRCHRVCGNLIVIATGSRPRTPANVPVDHEHILDSDSILSLLYRPASLTVLGGGVIASEYASIFASLGTLVTMIDRGARPVGFMDAELTTGFVRSFEANGGRFLGQQEIVKVAWDGLAALETTLASGVVVRSEKMLCALGRVANTAHLNLAAAGLQLNDRGYVAVDEHCRTAVPYIYAVGDVIGPPALASCSMEQGRRAVCHALGLPLGHAPETIPTGIYTVPEMACVGLNVEQATERHGGVLVGRARFDELTRGQITGITDGLLKMISDAEGCHLLGVHIIGEGATELIHVGQMGLLAGCDIDTFVDHVFNIPTLAEAYRVAALDIAEQRSAHLKMGNPAACYAPGNRKAVQPTTLVSACS
jgi:NAD(P) transhydrogenase